MGSVLSAGGAVEVSASSFQMADATGDALVAGGLVSIGGIAASADATGETRSHLHGTVKEAQTISVLANAIESANARTEAVNGGGFGSGQASFASAKVGDPDSTSDGVLAYVGDSSQLNASGSVLVQADSSADAQAEALGVSAAGALAVEWESAKQRLIRKFAANCRMTSRCSLDRCKWFRVTIRMATAPRRAKRLEPPAGLRRVRPE
ncbi:MAG: hypothetical protein R3C28_24925 [Pirellulaceae bacterium]